MNFLVVENIEDQCILGYDALNELDLLLFFEYTGNTSKGVPLEINFDRDDDFN